MDSASAQIAHSPCGMVLRLLAAAYDGLLLFAVLFAATAVLLPLTGGLAVRSGNFPYLLYLLGWSYLYFAWQWTHGGQTLGMRVWHVVLRERDNGAVGWPAATRRFSLALLSWAAAGAGFLWALFDPERLAFHDRYSGTRLYRVKPSVPPP